MLRLLRSLTVIALFGSMVLLGLGVVLLQKDPLLDVATPPSAEDVAATRTLVRNLRSATQGDAALTTDTAELNSAIRLGARFIPGFRGAVRLDGAALLGQVSIPVALWPGRHWLNVAGRVPEFDGAVRLEEVRVGAATVPPGLALAVARIGANLALGNRMGDRVLQAATRLEIEEDRLRFAIALDEMGTNGVMRGAFGAMRGNAMPGPEEIESYHLLIREAMADGRLPQEGSFLPHLRFALAAALERGAAGNLPNAYTAAVFGLAKACGAREFAVIVRRLAFDVAEFSDDWSASCDAVTLNGRVDSRLHFIASAALQAASNRGFSVSVGEFKELLDTISGSMGFDFTDMAANLSGIRMSNAFMSAPAAGWPALLARIETENDVIVPFDGIPPLMSAEDFEVRFGTVESPAYKALLAEIEGRIDGLALHAPGPL